MNPVCLASSKLSAEAVYPTKEERIPLHYFSHFIGLLIDMLRCTSQSHCQRQHFPLYGCIPQQGGYIQHAYDSLHKVMQKKKSS